MAIDSTPALAATGAVPDSERPLPAHLVDSARATIGAARAENTRAAYARGWQQFATWCATHGRRELPATMETVVAWMADLAQKARAPSTIDIYLSAVILAHRTAGHPFDRKHPLVAAFLKGLRRTSTRQRDEARPLVASELLALLDGLDGNPTLRARDTVLLLLGWTGALRRSELIGLDWQEVGTGTGSAVVEERGVSLRLLRSKASPDEPETIVIPHAEAPHLIGALDTWIGMAAVEPGAPLLRPVDQRGVVGLTRLTGHSVSRIIKRRVYEAALQRELVAVAERAARERRKPNRHDRAHAKAAARTLAEAFSGHSLRAGYATSAAEVDMPAYRIQQHTRHKSAEMVARYVREADKWTKSGLEGVLKRI